MSRVLLAVAVLAGCKGDAKREPTREPTTTKAMIPPAAPARPRAFVEAGDIAPGTQTLVVRRDGTAVAVGGTTDDLAPTPNVWIFDPAANKWGTGPRLRVARKGLTTLVLPDGAILAFGGYDARADVPIVERLDPVANTWNDVAPLPIPGRFIAGTVLPDGRVLAATGSHGKQCATDAMIYDPAKDQWTKVASAPEPRVGATIVLDNTNTPVLIGGDCRELGTKTVAPALRFDVAKGVWSRVEVPTTVATGGGTVALGDGSALVVGGMDINDKETASAAILDATASSWRAIPSAPITRLNVNMVQTRGSVLVFGHPAVDNDTRVDVYDVTANKWTRGPEVPVARLWDPQSVTLRDGRVLVVGGFDPIALTHDTRTWIY